MNIVVGLGNPGKEYENTRHNAGRRAVDSFRKRHDFPEWTFNKKLNAHTSEGKIGKVRTLLAVPDTFMNKSGSTVKALVKSKKAALDLLVVYDDLDIPCGSLKISFGRSSGGHNGLESVIRAVGTKDFPRLRLGVSPATAGGKLKKPQGEKKVLEFLLGKFSKKEEEEMTKFLKKAGEGIEVAVTEGYQMAMNKCN
jgi:PTH1 family peptidyl-tRNA hydrolase